MAVPESMKIANGNGQATARKPAMQRLISAKNAALQFFHRKRENPEKGMDVTESMEKSIGKIANLANARLASSDAPNLSYEVPMPAALRWFGKFMD